MAGFTQGFQAAVLDREFPTTGAADFIAYGTNSTTETTVVARTAVGATGWASATNADPSVKANANALTSAAATGTATLTHFAFFSASTGGTQKTDWTALASPRTVNAGDTLQWAVGAAVITLT